MLFKIAFILVQSQQRVRMFVHTYQMMQNHVENLVTLSCNPPAIIKTFSRTGEKLSANKGVLLYGLCRISLSCPTIAYNLIKRSCCMYGLCRISLSCPTISYNLIKGCCCMDCARYPSHAIP